MKPAGIILTCLLILAAISPETPSQCPQPVGNALLRSAGAPALGSSIALTLFGRPHCRFVLAVDTSTGPLVLPWGKICLGPQMVILANGSWNPYFTIPQTGKFTAHLTIPNFPNWYRKKLYFQAVILDSSSPNKTAAISNLVTLTLTSPLSKAWRHANYDLGGTARYPFSSTWNRGQLSLHRKLAFTQNDQVLTEDLNGDGVLDVITSDSNFLSFVDGKTGVIFGSVGLPKGVHKRVHYVGDVDGDKKPEVLVGFQDASNRLVVNVYDHDGRLNKTLDTGWKELRGSSGVRALGHWGDCILVGYGAGWDLQPRGVGIMRYSLGKEVAHYATGGGGIGGNFAIGDVNGNGLPDIALPWATVNNGVVKNGTTDRNTFGVLLEADVTKSTPTLTALFTKVTSAWNSSTAANGSMTAMIADLDHDGLPSAYFSHVHQSPYTGTDYLYKVGATGSLVAKWKGGANAVHFLNTVINDVNGDGIQEIVTSPYLAGANDFLTLVDGATLTTISSVKGKGRVFGAADLNGDGLDDLIVHEVATGDLCLYHGATLTQFARFNVGGMDTSHGGQYNRLVVSDVTGDGRLELILCTKTGGVLILRVS